MKILASVLIACLIKTKLEKGEYNFDQYIIDIMMQFEYFIKIRICLDMYIFRFLNNKSAGFFFWIGTEQK